MWALIDSDAVTATASASAELVFEDAPILAGDLIVLWCGVDSGGNTWATPDGFTQVPTTDLSLDSVACFWKLAAGDEDGVPITIDPTGSDDIVGLGIVLRDDESRTPSYAFAGDNRVQSNNGPTDDVFWGEINDALTDGDKLFVWYGKGSLVGGTMTNGTVYTFDIDPDTTLGVQTVIPDNTAGWATMLAITLFCEHDVTGIDDDEHAFLPWLFTPDVSLTADTFVTTGVVVFDLTAAVAADPTVGPGYQIQSRRVNARELPYMVTPRMVDELGG